MSWLCIGLAVIVAATFVCGIMFYLIAVLWEYSIRRG